MSYAISIFLWLEEEGGGGGEGGGGKRREREGEGVSPRLERSCLLFHVAFKSYFICSKTAVASCSVTAVIISLS